MKISRFSNIFTLPCSGSGKSPSRSGVRNRIGAEEDFNLAHRGNPRHLPDQARASSPWSWGSGELRSTSNYVKCYDKRAVCAIIYLSMFQEENTNQSISIIFPYQRCQVDIIIRFNQVRITYLSELPVEELKIRLTIPTTIAPR